MLQVLSKEGFGPGLVGVLTKARSLWMLARPYTRRVVLLCRTPLAAAPVFYLSSIAPHTVEGAGAGAGAGVGVAVGVVVGVVA